MVAEHEHWPPSGVHASNLFAKFWRGKFVHAGKQKIHWHLQFIAVLAVVELQFIDVFRPGFPDQHRIRFIGHSAQLAQHVVDFGQLGVVLILHVGIAVSIFPRQYRIVP